MSDWRLYARRTATGEWLHTDVPARCEFTTQLGGSGHAAGFIPKALDQETAADGKPLWWERGTTLYAERDQQLKWVGLCSWQRPTAAGREIEFKGLTSSLDLIGFEGRIREWQPDPFDLVERLVDHAARQPNGDVGLEVKTEGRAPSYAGDEQPPAERPGKVKRRRGESIDHFEERKAARAEAQEDWDKQYGDRRPYTLAWWESAYVKDEILELAREIPFDWYEHHRWTDREQLEARHQLIVTPRTGRVRSDLVLTEGVNIAEVIDPRTDSDRYGNHLVMLGAGEGSKMRRASVGSRDGRVRTTRYGEAKHVHNQGRLRARARAKFDRMVVSVKLDQAVVREDLGGLGLGDEIKVESQLFTGWCRVYGRTENTRDGNITLTFTRSGDIG